MTTCGCQPAVRLRIHRDATILPSRRLETFRGRTHLVVSVVMLREVVVNDAFVPLDELNPEGWNGVPVTLFHPEEHGAPVTANRPDILEAFAVGVIFNARLVGDRLCGEAWVDVELASRIAPGLLKALYEGRPMDVSTGYFPTPIDEAGVHNGRRYSEVHRDLTPDHLALLPDQEGACNWQDGCGVRTHRKRSEIMANGVGAQIARLLSGAGLQPRTNETGDSADDLAERLVADDATPFTGDELGLLQMMPAEVLEGIAEAFGVDEGDEGNGEEPAGNGDDPDEPEGNAEDPDEEPATNSAEVSPAVMVALERLVANALRQQAAQAERPERDRLVATIVANKSMGLSRADLRDASLVVLRQLAGKQPRKRAEPIAANYGGRGLQSQPPASGGAYPTMVAPSLVALAQKKEASQ